MFVADSSLPQRGTTSSNLGKGLIARSLLRRSSDATPAMMRVVSRSFRHVPHRSASSRQFSESDVKMVKCFAMVLMALLESYPMQGDVGAVAESGQRFRPAGLSGCPWPEWSVPGLPASLATSRCREEPVDGCREPRSIRELKIVLPRCFPSPAVT